MPFARNEATRYISPTKTPEYLAAGLPVVSTSIRDVVDPYGHARLARIADTADATIAAIERALAGERPEQADVDGFLASRSWDRTWAAMAELVDRLDVPRVAIPVRAEELPLVVPRTALPSAAPRQVARGSVAGRSVASSPVAGAGAGAREG
jgi:UDP-galactopyranose mutase